MLRGAGGAFVLVGLETLGGTFVLLWITMILWPAIDRGHYRSTTYVVAPLTAALAFALPGALRPVGVGAALLMAAFLIAVYSQRPLLEWLAGGGASALMIWAVAGAGLQSCACGPAGAGHALVGAFFLGAATHGMALGHWYLNQARLPIEPLKAAAAIFLGAVGASLAEGIVFRGRLLDASVAGGILPVSPSGYWLGWLMMILLTAVLAAMVRATVKARSNQSATGLLYIAMISGMSAQFLIALLLAS